MFVRTSIVFLSIGIFPLLQKLKCYDCVNFSKISVYDETSDCRNCKDCKDCKDCKKVLSVSLLRHSRRMNVTVLLMIFSGFFQIVTIIMIECFRAGKKGTIFIFFSFVFRETVYNGIVFNESRCS